MAETILDDVIGQVKNLSHADKVRLRVFLDGHLLGDTSDDVLDAQLLKVGLLSEIPAPVMDIESYEAYRPVKAIGKSVSEIIIEERR